MITNSDDIIDSRDVIARIAELEKLADWAEPDGYDLDEDEQDELTALRALAEDGENVEDWTYGATLIRDSYFEDYARQLAEDIGAIGSDTSWPATCIDWEWAARELRMDYTSIEFGDVTYWVRVTDMTEAINNSVALTLVIDNIYEDGTEARTTVQVQVPPPPLLPLDERGRHEEEAFAEEVEDWEQDHIFPLTGTGKTEGDAAYFVEVTEEFHPDLIPVGTKYEFGL